jgi:16S rRNA (guanine527-N7)-methyltransferase
LVVARAFGSPAATSECASPLLMVGSRLVVSEPPEAAGKRWPADGLAAFGLSPERAAVSGGAHFQVLRQVEVCPDRFPRRNGLPRKRPLF